MNIVATLVRRPVFTYVQDDGTNINIDIQNLRSWCLVTGPKIQRIFIEEAVARHFIDKNVASLCRVTELSRRPLALLDPSILCRHGFNSDGSERTMYADGHHRYVLAYMNKLPYIPAFVLEPSQWEPFTIKGLPSMTQRELQDLPITKRNY